MRHLTRRRLLTLAALAGAGALAGCAVRATPSAADAPSFDDARRTPADGLLVRRDGFSFVETDWLDPARGRPVPVRLYLPERPDGALPLVVFSHGLGGSRRGYSYLGTHLARHGWASLHVQHVGSDRGIWAGNPLTLPARLQGAAREQEAMDRALDLRHALDRLLAQDAPRAMRVAVDADRIVAAGHSYGANTALLAAGAEVVRDGRTLNLRDGRIDAAILISAPPFHGESDMGPILRPVAAPTLHVTATEDDIRVPGYGSTVADRVAVFEATGSRDKALAVFRGGSHSIFTDRPYTGGSELNPRVKLATQDLVLAFLARVFERRGDALAGWAERHREIVARFVATA